MTNSLSPTAEREAKEREAFKAWAKDFDLRPSIMAGHYKDMTVDFMWKAWQARAALLEPVGEGWVMVPKEPTPEMVAEGLQELYTTSGGDFDAVGEEVADTYKRMIAASPKTNGGMGS